MISLAIEDDEKADLLTIIMAIRDLHKVMELSGQLFKMNKTVLYCSSTLQYMFPQSTFLSGKVFKVSLWGIIGWESC